MATPEIEHAIESFRGIVREVDNNLDLVEGMLEGRPFWFLAKGSTILHRRRSDGRPPTQADQLLRVEPEKTVLKVSALVGPKEIWEREIRMLAPPCFSVLQRTTKRHKERLTFTGAPAAFEMHRLFLAKLVRTCVTQGT